jgi:hypothetical protein
MKKISIAIALCFTLALAGIALAEDWYPANGSTLAWDQNYTVTRADGTTFTVPASEVTFRVYRVLAANVAKTNPEFLGNTVEKTFLVRFAEEGKYHLGVQAVRTVAGIESIASPIGWSDDAALTDNKPFGVVFVIPPATPTGISVE